MNYDPNLFLCGNRARQEIKLTFGMWQYRQERTVISYSNISGLDAINFAVEQTYESLPGFGRHDIPQIVLTADNGDTMTCDDDEEEGKTGCSRCSSRRKSSLQCRVAAYLIRYRRMRPNESP